MRLEKKYILRCAIAIIFLLGVVVMSKSTSVLPPPGLIKSPSDGNITVYPKDNLPTQERDIQPSMDTIPHDWMTYSNPELGFTFRHPSTWVKYDEVNVSDRSGNTAAIEVKFNDRVSSAKFSILYTLSMAGSKIYQDLQAQYEDRSHRIAGSKKIEVAGNTAIVTSNVWTENGKGEPIPPEQVILVDLLHVRPPGEIQFQFHSFSTDEDDVNNFNLVLTTFRFIP